MCCEVFTDVYMAAVKLPVLERKKRFCYVKLFAKHHYT